MSHIGIGFLIGAIALAICLISLDSLGTKILLLICVLFMVIDFVFTGIRKMIFYEEYFVVTRARRKREIYISKIQVRYEDITKYTLGFVEVAWKDPSEYLIELVEGNPIIFVKDKYGKEHRIPVQDCTKNQITEILNELSSRTGILPLKDISDWQETDYFKKLD